MDWLNRITGKGSEGIEYHDQAKRDEPSNRDIVLMNLMHENGRVRIEFWNPKVGRVQRLDGRIVSVNMHTHVMTFSTNGQEVRLLTAHIRNGWRLREKPRNPPHPSGPHEITSGPVGRELESVKPSPAKYPGYPPGMQSDDPFAWRARREWDRAKAEMEEHREQERQRREIADPHLFTRPIARPAGTVPEQSQNPNNLPGQYLPGGDPSDPASRARRDEYDRFERLGGTREEWVGKYGKWPNGHYRLRHELSTEEAEQIDRQWNERYAHHPEPVVKNPEPTPKVRHDHDDAT